MLNKILFGFAILALIFIICSCAMQRQIILSQPGESGVVFVPPEKAVVLGDSVLVPNEAEILEEPFTAYYPDPTKGMIKNYSRLNLVVDVWLNSAPSSPPTVKLLPQQAIRVYAPLGTLRIYAEGKIKTVYGWQSVGSFSREYRISSYSYWGDDGWEIYIWESDFPRW